MKILTSLLFILLLSACVPPNYVSMPSSGSGRCVGSIGPGGACSIGPGGGQSIGPGGGRSIGPGGGRSVIPSPWRY